MTVMTAKITGFFVHISLIDITEWQEFYWLRSGFQYKVHITYHKNILGTWIVFSNYLNNMQHPWIQIMGHACFETFLWKKSLLDTYKKWYHGTYTCMYAAIKWPVAKRCNTLYYVENRNIHTNINSSTSKERTREKQNTGKTIQ
jgi:hypothetical protein